MNSPIPSESLTSARRRELLKEAGFTERDIPLPRKIDSPQNQPAARRAYNAEAWRPDMTFQEFRREVWSPTDPEKTYVIAKMHVEFGIKRSVGMLYLCLSKTMRKTNRPKAEKQYWGLYIGTAGKRYGAARFAGGEELDRLLAANGNRDLIAVEVKL